MSIHAIARRLASLCLVLASSLALAAAPTPKADILWDTWGVPHIEATDDANLFHAFGWSQAHSHGDLLLRLYGQARGRAAEYWGEAYLESDRWVRVNGVPERGQAWLAQQSPDFRHKLEAFAAGINAYAGAHPERLDPAMRRVLPLSAADVLAHQQRVIHFSFLTNRESALEETESEEGETGKNGSNAWAIAPARTAKGKALLLANPHLPWSDHHLFYEAQLRSPGVNVYGVALIGFPVIVIGFNERLGWTHTVNPIDAADVYRLALADSGYRWDGAIRQFELVTQTLRVRQADGSLAEQTMQVKRSLHGPVIKEEGAQAYALRVAGLDRPKMAEQWWAMAKAANLDQFETAMRALQIPMFNVVYADRGGNILYLYNGLVPKRHGGSWDHWQAAVNGESSSNLWQEVHSYAELPRVLNPASHWLQNANDPPWFATLPAALRPSAYPSYFAPPSMGLRAQRSARLVAGGARISLEDMIRYKQATRVELADRVLDALLAAPRPAGGVVDQAARVLGAWDRTTDAESRGAVLFAEWANEAGFLRAESEKLYATPWQVDRPVTTPFGLADPQNAVLALERAAAKVIAAHGALDVKWGTVARLRRDASDLPASGGPGALGIYPVLSFKPQPDGKRVAVHGDTFVAAVEFGTRPRAQVLLSYGNASQPGSPHRIDQLPLLAQKKMRPAWRTRQEIQGHLARRETLRYRPGAE